MEWESARRSDNIEDRRGDDGGGGGGIGLPGGGGLGIGAIVILAIIGYVTGIDPRLLVGGAERMAGQHGSASFSQNQAAPARTGTPKDQMGDFVAAALGEIEDVWTEQLPAQRGIAYVKPRLVLYSGITHSGCGQAQSAMGPFYCPADQKIYLDMAFFNDMKAKLGGGGYFAYAYVIAHEAGHHVQNLLGTLPNVQAQQAQSSQQQANGLSVRLELQADCYAGVWAANAEQKWRILNARDVGQALATAAAIGDDRLQTAARGYAVPDSFTHGSSAQRQQWLMTGLKTGRVDACNTFAR